MKNKTHTLLLIAFLPLAILLVIIIHEIGHVTIARLFGDTQASYSLYKRYPDGGFCIGCYSFGVLPPTATSFVKIGGVIFTQFFFIAIFLALRTKIVNFVPRLPATLLAVLFFLDLPLQILQGFRPSPDAPQSGIDLADFSQLVALQTNRTAFSIKLALVVVFVIYFLLMVWLYRSRPESAKHGNSG
jgi:hypothetical protein